MVLGDLQGVVYLVAGQEQKAGVALHVVVHVTAADAERADDAVGQVLLLGAVDHARVDQLHHGVAHHLGVQAQVVLVTKVAQHAVGYVAVADVQGVAVVDQAGRVGRDLLAHRVQGRVHELGQLLVQLHKHVDVPHVQEAVAHGAGHAPVHLGDDHVGTLGRGPGQVHADAQGHEAVVVGRAHLDQGHVQLHLAPAEQVRDLVHEYGRIVRAGLAHRLAGGGADEKGVVPKSAVEALVRILGPAQGHEVQELHVVELVGPLQQGRDQAGRLGAGRAQENPLAALDGLHGPHGIHFSRFVYLPPRHLALPRRSYHL